MAAMYPAARRKRPRGWFRFVLPFSKLIWKKAAAVIAVSAQTRELALEHYDTDIQVIPNGIDTEAMKPQDLKVHTPPRILFIGRFSPEKNAIAVPKILANLKIWNGIARCWVTAWKWIRCAT